MAVPQGGIDFTTASLEDFLAAAADMTVQELLVELRDMQQRTGITIPFVAAITAAVASGKYIGATGPSGVIGEMYPLRVANQNGDLVVANGVDDNGVPQNLLCDRLRILGVGPPVRTLAQQSALVVGAGTPTFTIPAPPAGQRVLMLGWHYTIACGANALVPSNGSAGGAFAVACPVNDSRSITSHAPFIGPAATAVVVSGPAAPALAQSSIWACWYYAGLP
jgi:hypothetical protein